MSPSLFPSKGLCFFLETLEKKFSSLSFFIIFYMLPRRCVHVFPFFTFFSPFFLAFPLYTQIYFVSDKGYFYFIFNVMFFNFLFVSEKFSPLLLSPFETIKLVLLCLKHVDILETLSFPMRHIINLLSFQDSFTRVTCTLDAS